MARNNSGEGAYPIGGLVGIFQRYQVNVKIALLDMGRK